MVDKPISVSQKLQPKAVQTANKQLWAKHPELNGRQLTNSNEDKKYRQEWNKTYREEKQKQNPKAATSNSPAAKKSSILPCQQTPANPKVAPTVPVKNKTEKEKCKFSTLSVDKSDRKYTLNMTPGQASTLPKMLEVVGGEKNKPAEITAKLNGLVQSGNTCNHTNNTFNYFLDNEELMGKPTSSELKFKAFAPPYTSFKIWNVQPNLYQFNVATCGAQTGATIAVYPDTKYDVTLEFPKPEYKNENKLSPKNEFQNIEIENTKSIELGVGISGSIERDGVKDSIEYEFKNEIDKFKQVSTISKGLQQHLSVLNNGGKVEPVSFTIKFPNLKFEYKGNWKEQEGSPLCDFENELSLRFDPLIGVDVNVDLIATAAVAFGGPFGKILLYVRQIAEKEVDIEFNFVLSGEAGGGWTGKYSKKEQRWKSSDKDITVTIAAKLEAKIKGKLDLIILYFGAGSEGVAKGSLEFKANVDNEAKLTVTAEHKGLKFTGCVYISGGWKNVFRDDDEDEESNDFKRKKEIEVEIIAPQESPLLIYP